MVICLERGADLHMAQLMPLSLTVSCFSKIQFGFAFLVPTHPGSPGKRAAKRVYVCNVPFFPMWFFPDRTDTRLTHSTFRHGRSLCNKTNIAVNGRWPTEQNICHTNKHLSIQCH